MRLSNMTARLFGKIERIKSHKFRVTSQPSHYAIPLVRARLETSRKLVTRTLVLERVDNPLLFLVPSFLTHSLYLSRFLPRVATLSPPFSGFSLSYGFALLRGISLCTMRRKSSNSQITANRTPSLPIDSYCLP